MGKIDKFDNKYFGTQVTHTYLENEAPIRLPEGVEIKEGSVVILERENRNITNVTLGASLKSGGQGIIYECKELPNYVIKILFDNDRTTYYKKKLRELIKFSNTNSQICWPEGVVRKNDFFIGFLMPKVVGNNLSWLEHHTSAQILERYPNFDRKTQVKIILDVLKQFEYLHSKNILVGDVKLENIMFDEKTFSVTMVDMDSVQAGEFNCTQTTPGYDAPEVIMCQGKENYNKRFDNKDYMFISYYRDCYRSLENEYYAIAVLLFRFLMRENPYFYENFSSYEEECLDDDGDTKYGWTNEDFELKQCINFNFQYDTTSDKRSSEHIWSYFPSFLKQAFVNVFKHNERLSPQEWIVIFERYSKLLDTRLKKVDEGCNDIEPEFYMVYEDVDFPLNAEFENCGFNMVQAVQRCVEECGDSSLFSNVQQVAESLKSNPSCVVDDYRFSLVYNIGVLKKVKLEVV